MAATRPCHDGGRADSDGPSLLPAGSADEDLDRASGWFARHGSLAVFVCRMIPGLRSLISIPARIHGMPLISFLLFTTLGTALWTAMLVWAGYMLGADFARVDEFLGPVSCVVVAVVLVIYAWRVVRHKGAAKEQ